MKTKIVQLSPQLESPFAAFLKRLRDNGDEEFFSPHELTDAKARELAKYTGKDYYCIAVDGNHVVGYGLLRGWDEGYDRPSLGIAVDPGERGKGLSKALMAHLHDVARKRGAGVMRLRVKKNNERAIRLYQDLGYDLKPDEKEGFLVGFATL